MGVAIVTGSGGLIGSEMAEFLVNKGLDVHGIDNNMRKLFFGSEASTEDRTKFLQRTHRRFHHHEMDRSMVCGPRRRPY